MQKVIEFKKRKFWTGKVDLVALNRMVEQLNVDGWQVTHMSPTRAGANNYGGVLLLIESNA